MITLNGSQAFVLHNSEVLYNTYYCEDVYKVTDDLFVIKERNNTLVLVYCSFLLVKLDSVMLYKIYPGYGVMVYEEIIGRPLGLFYNHEMVRLAWFIQEMDALYFFPQGNFNLLLTKYKVIGFTGDKKLIIESATGSVGVWNTKSNRFVEKDAEIAFDINTLDLVLK